MLRLGSIMSFNVDPASGVGKRLNGLVQSFADSMDDLFAKWEAFAIKRGTADVHDPVCLDAFQAHLERPTRSNAKRPRISVRNPSSRTPKREINDEIKYEVTATPKRKFYGRATASASVGEILPAKFSLNSSMDPFIQKRPFNQNLRDISRELDQQIEDVAESVMSARGLIYTDFLDPHQIGQSIGWAVGRVCLEKTDAGAGGDDESENTSLIGKRGAYLEAPRKLGNGSRTRLDLENVSEELKSQLYVGEIIAVKGRNSKGTEFTVHEVAELPRLPLAGTRRANGPLKIAIARAPASHLPQLLSYLNSTELSAAIILGPVGPAEILTQTQPRVPFVMVPSPEDPLSTDAVFPQPPLTVDTARTVVKVSNPCTFSLGEAAITAANVPTLTDLDLPPNMTFKEVLRQRRLYPMYPPHEGTSIDVPKLRHARLEKAAPHMLVLPAKASTECYAVDDVLCVAVGSFPEIAVLTVKPGDSALSSRTSVEVCTLEVTNSNDQ